MTPGMDYLTEYEEPTAGNPYSNVTAMTIGEIGLGWVVASRLKKKLSKFPVNNVSDGTFMGNFRTHRRNLDPSTSYRSWTGKKQNKRSVRGVPHHTPTIAEKKIQIQFKKAKRLGRLFGMVGAAQIGIEIAKAIGNLGASSRASEMELSNNSHNSFYTENEYYDSRAASNQRQRALQVIHNSRLSSKPTLGSEASYFHQ
jgi:hypothetical protein